MDMIPQSTAAAIQLSMDEIRKPNSFWPLHMINFLATKDVSRLVPWIGNTLLAFLDRHGHPIYELLTDQLHEVLATSSGASVCGILDSWNVGPSDSIVSCHMHVLLAKQYLLNADRTKLRTSVVWFLIIFCDADVGISNRLPIVLEEYYKQVRLP